MNSAPAAACFSYFTCLPPTDRGPRAVPSRAATQQLRGGSASSCWRLSQLCRAVYSPRPVAVFFFPSSRRRPSSNRRRKLIAVTTARLNSSRTQLRLILVLLANPLAPPLLARIGHGPGSHRGGTPSPPSTTSPWPARFAAALFLPIPVLASS